MRFASALRQRIAAQVREAEGSCLLWTGCVCDSGYPRITVRGKQIRRSIAWQILTGRKLPRGWMVTATCGHNHCMQMAHLVAMSRSDLMRTRVPAKSADVVARMTAARRRRAKIGLDGAREMRARREAGVTVRQLAREYGLAISSTSRIVNNKVYRERGPFDI